MIEDPMTSAPSEQTPEEETEESPAEESGVEESSEDESAAAAEPAAEPAEGEEAPADVAGTLARAEDVMKQLEDRIAQLAGEWSTHAIAAQEAEEKRQATVKQLEAVRAAHASLLEQQPEPALAEA